MAPRLIKAGVDRKVRGEEGASDHAPAWIVLKVSYCGTMPAALMSGSNRASSLARKAIELRRRRRPCGGAEFLEASFRSAIAQRLQRL